jgi:predicted CXXCH cytochrome family protein
LTGKIIAEVDGNGSVANERAWLGDEPLRIFTQADYPQAVTATPDSSRVCLKWGPVPGASYYQVCWGDAAGAHPNCSPNIYATSYCVDGLTGVGTRYFIINSFDSTGSSLGQSQEITATLVVPSPALPHYNYSPVIGGQADCTICHIQPGSFMTGFGVRSSVELCYSCHSAAGVGHNRNAGGLSHPVFVDATAGLNHRLPTLGSLTGMGSDSVPSHLLNGKQVVCMTCHNPHTKPHDAGREWEYTSTADDIHYTFQNGGWQYFDYLRPVVYRDATLWSGPAELRKRRDLIVPDSEFSVDAAIGTITFKQAQPSSVYIYVSLDNAYLRNTNEQNQMCLDCHITATHKGNNCTACHGSHNTGNLYNVREKINGRAVSYKTVTSMPGSTGVCVVCHIATIYHNATAHVILPHNDKTNCMDCHPHKKGFPSFTTVLTNIFGKLFALIAGGPAYAEPAPLENYSISGSAPVTIPMDIEVTVEPMTTYQAPATTTKIEVGYYYHNDHLGTPLFMTDDNGKVVWQREQMPFGETTYERGTEENLRFPGQYWDEEKGTSDNGFRTYNQKIGKYSEADPIGQTDGVNPYIYAQQNPLTNIDPTGETVSKGFGMDSEFPLASVMIGLECMSKCLKSPIYISSGWRTEEQNSATPGAAKESQHLKGLAADVHEPPSQTKLRMAATECGFFVLSKSYPNRIHVDLRGGRTPKSNPDDCKCKKIREEK